MKDSTAEAAFLIKEYVEDQQGEDVLDNFKPIYKGEGCPQKRIGNNHKKYVKEIMRKKCKAQKQARKLNRRG